MAGIPEDIGRQVANRIGINVREVRTRLGLTQAQLAAPEYSISYISAIERGKIRPSLKALNILCKRLDVTMAFILEGTATGAAEAMAVGYNIPGIGPEQETDLALLCAQVYILQRHFSDASGALVRVVGLTQNKITTGQALTLFMLQGQISLETGGYQQAVTHFNAALQQAGAINDQVGLLKARDALGTAYYMLGNNTLALRAHEECVKSLSAAGSELFTDPMLVARIYGHLADDLWRSGKFDEAREKAAQAMELLDTFGGSNPRLIAVQMAETGERYMEEKNLNQAANYMQMSAGIYSMLEEQRQYLLTQLELGKFTQAQGNPTDAEKLYRSVVQSAGDDLEFSDVKASAYICLAELQLVKPDPDLQAALDESDLALTAAEGSPVTKGLALVTRGNILSRLEGRDDEVDATFTAAFQLLPGRNLREAYRVYAIVLEERKDYQKALEYQKKAITSPDL